MSREAGPTVGIGPRRLSPERHARPWGGGRFGSIEGVPVGELWVSGDDAMLPDGRTLVEAGLAASLPLVKVLDVGGTLSVQVHPDDATARELLGPGAVGKHECWVVLEAPAGATVAVGMAPGASMEDLFGADERRIAAALRHLPVSAGTVLDIPPGAVHAPGGELVLYEVQQRSDLTFRIWDWGRPRLLHLEEARRAIRPAIDPLVGSLAAGQGVASVGAPGAPFRLLSCVVDASGPVQLVVEAAGILSVIEGSLLIAAAGAASATGWPPVEAGSHWLLPAGRWELGGHARALLATW